MKFLFIAAGLSAMLMAAHLSTAPPTPASLKSDCVQLDSQAMIDIRATSIPLDTFAVDHQAWTRDDFTFAMGDTGQPPDEAVPTCVGALFSLPIDYALILPPNEGNQTMKLRLYAEPTSTTILNC